MVDEGARPGVQQTHHTEATADESWIEGQLSQRLGRSAKQNVVDRLLIAARDGSQLSGQREGHEEVSNGQQQVPLFCEPFVGLLVLALRTVTVLAPHAAASITEEPGARKRHAGICAGAVGQLAVLPRWFCKEEMWITTSRCLKGRTFLPSKFC